MTLSCGKKISELLPKITFLFLNRLHSLGTENKLESREKVCENKDFCRNVMTSQKDNIL